MVPNLASTVGKRYCSGISRQLTLVSILYIEPFDSASRVTCCTRIRMKAGTKGDKEPGLDLWLSTSSSPSEFERVGRQNSSSLSKYNQSQSLVVLSWCLCDVFREKSFIVTRMMHLVGILLHRKCIIVALSLRIRYHCYRSLTSVRVSAGD